MHSPVPSGPLTLRSVRVLGASPTDVTIARGRVVAGSNGRVIAADDLVLLPGLVDLHTHLREPGGEDAETIESGSAAAAAGGYSDVFAMANTRPVTDSADRVEAIRATAARAGQCRVHPVGAITVGLAGTRLAPVDELVAAGVTMLSDDGRCVDDPALMAGALVAAARHGVVVAQHAQSHSLAEHGQINEGAPSLRTGLAAWPAEAESQIVERDIALADAAGARLHVCHVSTEQTVRVLRAAKSAGARVTAEVTPHHLFLTDALTLTADARFKVNPPLRSLADVAAVRAALADGTIDAVATDHAPHPEAHKRGAWAEAAFGLIGLETALAVVADVLGGGGEPDWQQVAECMSYAPAQIGSLSEIDPRPAIVGGPATFTLIEDAGSWTVDGHDAVSRSNNTAFDGKSFRWRVAATLVDGRVTYDRTGLFDERDSEIVSA